MGKMIFTGRVKGFSMSDDGKVHLTVEEESVCEKAREYEDKMRREFNPHSRNHGFGANEVHCNIRPGVAPYHFTLDPDNAKNISYDSRVEVTLEVFNFRRVKFWNKRWGGIPELRYELDSIRLATDYGKSDYSKTDSKAATTAKI